MILVNYPPPKGSGFLQPNKVYEPTGKTMKESVAEWFKYSSLDFSKVSDKQIAERCNIALQLSKEIELSEPPIAKVTGF